jgi:hypothetical protein
MRIVDSKIKHEFKFSLEFENRRKKIKMGERCNQTNFHRPAH